MTHILPTATLDFTLPPDLEAHEPPEARGLARDDVRLLVSRVRDDTVTHAHFRDLPNFLTSDDLLVLNTSGTLPAALRADRADGTPLVVHLSTHLPADLWTVEVRLPTDIATAPFRHAHAGETLTLPGGGGVTLLAPYSLDRAAPPSRDGTRLWIAALHLPCAPHTYLATYLAAHGRPIRYGYVPRDWPLEAYQTVYATESGSAEMPSAGRAFTPDLLTRLVAKGVRVAPLVLHTGVASLEDHEPPYEEFYRVPDSTARAVNETRANGGRVLAVGTTVVRALETVTDARGTAHPGEGWTREVITPQRGVRAVNGLLTGWHEPRASHLLMLAALAGERHLRAAYEAALQGRYLWHEFGDLHLIVP
ncbi:S-adenosylmethionine:tRNA ribosyltransferase-isomerase [Deinococcus yavapaiensis]|uniref:S-adenosylmethionine--tRNA ribosyltransferase-isomerase n=1 Tax=Deinococcus yavapaiensis KR-236 TaxID=694435 RepID=A0A318RZK3_9DEIO|nr:S-adenosylmethionine:tRNA ribosyltransferase-isomerase [Deinococcus yavapaiensis]PYE49378.1 S-adenosylmethionine--tRNA ribosyltransferase-isomerase [Deinococcus yavapaiensis KR-236]